MFKSTLIDYGPSKGGFSVVCFWCQRFCDVLFYVCSSCFILSCFAEVRPFGEELFSPLTIHALLVLLLIMLFLVLPFMGFAYVLLLDCS